MGRLLPTLRCLVVAALAAGLVPGLLSRADVPNLIDFQGSLTDGQGRPVSGQKSLTFTIYGADTGGVGLWQETQTLTVIDGVYSTGLGKTVQFPDNLWDNPQLWLGVRVGADAEMTPRVRLVAVPFALRAKVAEFAKVAETAQTLAGPALPPGAMVLSERSDDPALTGQGYVLAGQTTNWESAAAWRSMAMENGPDTYVVAPVWTGKEMLVWERWPTGNQLRGFRYDPVANAWMVTSPVGAPEARSGFTVVWTGTHAIVWGGETHAGVYLNTGAIYVPAADAWHAMSTVGAPVARSSHKWGMLLTAPTPTCCGYGLSIV